MTCAELLAGARWLPEKPHGLAGKEVLVTGACGSIGSVLLDRLLADGVKAHGVDRDELGVARAVAEGKPVILGEAAMVWGNPQVVFHCAAYKHVVLGKRFHSAFWLNNVDLTQAVIRSYPMAKVVLCSTDKAAGVSQMGVTKYRAEQAVLRHGGVALRLVNCLGSRGSVIDVWNDRIARGLPIRCVPGKVGRYWMQAADAAEALIRVASEPPGLYTVYGCPWFSMEQVRDGYLAHRQLPVDQWEWIPLAEEEATEEKLVSHKEALEPAKDDALRKIVRKV